MSRRSYHAFIRAARKTGGLSLPAARRVYKKVSDRLGEPAKAVDVKRHPRIFRESLLKRDREKVKKIDTEKREKRREREKENPEKAPEKRRIDSIRDFERMEDLMLQEDIEYASTAEY